ncbi:MAG: hypothetical protein ACRDTC_18770 [Pseudonocardiaceae bacterium]
MIIDIAWLLSFLVSLGAVVLCWKRSRTRSTRRARHRRDSLWPVVLAVAGIGRGAEGVAVTGQRSEAR